jgi:hypothetical protein
MEAREENRENFETIKKVEKTSLVKILKDRGFNISRRKKTAAE